MTIRIILEKPIRARILYGVELTKKEAELVAGDIEKYLLSKKGIVFEKIRVHKVDE